ncbi:hypothetical protein SH1V18_17370 [Vallitalea longa]|uniref:Uncharacterized protein n=1 Tax=Vallitalea longa TaxID=2936439 RepID=A0A9W5Y8P2_9FIRM|nr:M50 family metallopeptidase [Vallitalea longa]GKX29257.1 hypothetical protein SH1V18_17370 [Vallitalea longa]
MGKKQKKKKIVWPKFVGIVLFMAIGAICGLLIANYIDSNAAEDISLGEELLTFFSLIIVMYISIFIHLIIHEAGHLIFGLMTGYSFSSFRIMSFMWVKENYKIKFKRLTLAGTGGQCLMTPPQLVDGKIPVVLYNLGGSFMNIITGLIFLGMYFVFQSIPFLSTVMLMMVAVGFVLAIMNGVPMRMGIIDNDGYNAYALSRNRDALRSFWVQMKANEQLTKGIRLKDMPDEWFTTPSDEEMKNSMVAVRGVFACSRMIDTQSFAQAYKLMTHFLEIDSAIVGLHRRLMVCDCAYCELIGENRSDVLKQLFTKKQIKFMKSMKKFPSVLRTEYSYALLSEKDLVKAEGIKVKFEKCAKTYPYPSEIQAERELMDIAEQKSKNI